MPYIAVLILILVLIIYGLMVEYRHKKECLTTEVTEEKNGNEHYANDNTIYYYSGRKSNCKRRIMKSLDKGYAKILDSYEYIDRDVRNKKEILPAAEWLLDNLYLIEKEYKDIKHNMPAAYYKDLPIIGNGSKKGFPRVYAVALDLVSSTDGKLDENSIESYINEYQKNSIFTSGELWALPIMLRIALIHNISNTIDKIIFTQREKNRADVIANRIIFAANEKKINYEIEKMSREDIDFTSHFTERLIKILRDNGIDNSEVYKFIDEKLQAKDLSVERMINIEHKKQASLELSMGRSISGIREVEALNFKEVFEKLSSVEKILRKDPAGIYSNMDFESRDHYRHKIEKLAKSVNVAESFVAVKAVECAEEASEDKAKGYTKHIGYYLIDEGIEALKKKVIPGFNGSKGLRGKVKKNSVAFYVWSIITLTLLLMISVILISLYYDKQIIMWKYVLGFIAIIIPCSEIIISILNWSITHLTEPRFVPKMEFKEGVPENCATLVVIPTLLNNQNKVHDMMNDMEIYYLANQDKNIYYALLGDFVDSNSEHNKEDKSIIEAALKDAAELNKKYVNSGSRDIFYFFNRKRLFNESENKWMGWERKRGKLMEFIELLKGSKDTTYDIFGGEIDNLKNIKYIITLDADTKLPRDSAKKLIGAMAHPLNIPVLDNDNKKVLRGYGLMQPRVTVSTTSANKTLYSQIFSGETGIDIYTCAISDVYQDLFSEGTYTGKGIFDVDVFRTMLKDEISENAVLSHDLLEGSYVRCALVSDIELVDGFPAYYDSAAKRLHRWVRGDWQLIPWLSNKRLNLLAKYKIFDNLRRSLAAPAAIILTILAIWFLPDGIDKWLVVAVLSLICPVLFNVSEEVINPNRGVSLSGRVDNFQNALEQFFIIFSFLPYKTYLMLDAVLRTLYRLFVSKKNLLEWQTSADVEASSGRSLKSYINTMWSGCAIALFILLSAYYHSYAVGIAVTPSCVLWIISPYIAFYISKDKKVTSEELSEEQTSFFREVSRRTWAYFEDFVSPLTNYLSPDNYQEVPENGIAYRTSPTNMGMGITSNIAARDLGFIGISETIERIDKVLTSMKTLKMYKGHFYNWYDIKTREPLSPKYISAVDSGNLVGYMWVTVESLNEYLKSPVLNEKMVAGVRDVLKLADDEIKSSGEVSDFYGDLGREFLNGNINLIDWKNFLKTVLDKNKESEKVKTKEELYWNIKVKHSITRYMKDCQKLFPWVDLVANTNESMASIYGRLIELPYKTSLCDIPDELDRILNEASKSSNEIYNSLKQYIEQSKRELLELINKIEAINSELKDLSEHTDFKILYDKKRQLFSIGYDTSNDVLENCYYDLLASEARCASFIAIAKGDVDQKHWFKLGRAMTKVGGSKCIVSWSGTMFEYFMPLLIMKSYPGTLLNETYKTVVEWQKRYCSKKKVPWGISESAFYSFDIGKNYQYKAFGVPGIGLKRGLANELVISPYSTILALMIDKQGAYNNMLTLKNEGLLGRYGFYEAVDYTKDRLSKGRKKAIVKSFMIHHEGMSLMSLQNVLNSNILQDRFHRIPEVKATELLLQERVPKRIIYEREQQIDIKDINIEKQNIIVRRYNTAKTEIPETHIMSNGVYSVMITNSGSGYSKRDDLNIYRWREDVTEDCSGMFFYIKDMSTHKYYSATYSPCLSEGDSYKVLFSLDKAEFVRKDRDLVTHTEVTVSSEENAEVRRITITNNGPDTKVIEVTSYMEVTITTMSSDAVHPAFSNLFVTTEFYEANNCIIAKRRPRSKGDERNFVVQTVALEGEPVGTLQYETSRINFIGRGRSVNNPEVMDNDFPLKNTVGSVLDPIISLRQKVKIPPEKSIIISFTTGISDSKEEAVEIAKKYKEIYNTQRAFELSTTQTQVEMNYLGIKSPQANLYQIMASRVLYMGSSLNDREAYIKGINRGQQALWAYGISGDLPIVLVVVKKTSDTDIVRRALSAHEYWSIKGLKADLVILNCEGASYMQPIENSIRELIMTSHARDKQNKKGGVFLLSEANLNKDYVNLFMAISRLVIDSDSEFISDELKSNLRNKSIFEKLEVKNSSYVENPFKFPEKKLQYFNDIGGFDEESNEYVILLRNGNYTPAPWINVISNGKFGFHVSENGSSYTWFKNSRENKITPWSNDWITDYPGELMYIRDEMTGEFWGVTPYPKRDESEYFIQYGFGYSTFKHYSHGIISEMSMFVPKSESVKIGILKLKNNTDAKRELSITYYAMMALGVVPHTNSQYISSYINEKDKYIYANNPYSEYFGNCIAYLRIIGGTEESFTGSRKEFIGRGRNFRLPEAMEMRKLSNRVGSGFDPCLAENVKIVLQPNEEKNIVILFGEDENLDTVSSIVKKYEIYENAVSEFESVKEYWKNMLQTIKVNTPDSAMNLMLNGWLLYQTIACRLWSRTAFYQSGGAFGFRDQLQDSMALGYVDPEMIKDQILYSASRQFVEGDVQHWWHPVIESGIRTRFSDDLLWLPYVTIDYIKKTGDYGILDENAGYLEDEPLREGEDERYTVSKKSQYSGTIYEHCIKAIDKALKFGVHNIPLMGSGDWNDGMNSVGNEGKGESVWLGWFLYSILDDFCELCKFKKDESKFLNYNEMKEFIKENMEENAWDGSWYRRAYFDDGTPLGSMENDECQIDSISQSWSVISGAGDKDRIKTAMASVEKYLVKEDKGMVLLLTPAFNNSYLEPGYIKGYVPGVRENGGQYTHAATWVILAFTKLKDGNKAWKIFNMINPINHTKSFLECEIYKVEPYVMAADVYAREPHLGRGGWTWYTGASGWMYRVGIEGILGLKIMNGKAFTIDPCIPDEWNGFSMDYKRGNATYRIQVKRGEDKGISLNGKKLEDNSIPFYENGEHNIVVII